MKTKKPHLQFKHCLKPMLLLLVIICIHADFIIAQVIHVPADYTTIQEAINAANNGDIIDYFLKHEKILIYSPQEAGPVQAENRFKGTLRDIIFKGQHSAYFVVLENGEELVVNAATEMPSLKIRRPVELAWPPEAGDAFLTEEH